MQFSKNDWDRIQWRQPLPEHQLVPPKIDLPIETLVPTHGKLNGLTPVIIPTTSPKMKPVKAFSGFFFVSFSPWMSRHSSTTRGWLV